MLLLCQISMTAFFGTKVAVCESSVFDGEKSVPSSLLHFACTCSLDRPNHFEIIFLSFWKSFFNMWHQSVGNHTGNVLVPSSLPWQTTYSFIAHYQCSTSRDEQPSASVLLCYISTESGAIWICSSKTPEHTINSGVCSWYIFESILSWFKTATIEGYINVHTFWKNIGLLDPLDPILCLTSNRARGPVHSFSLCSRYP